MVGLVGDLVWPSLVVGAAVAAAAVIRRRRGDRVAARLSPARPPGIRHRWVERARRPVDDVVEELRRSVGASRGDGGRRDGGRLGTGPARRARSGAGALGAVVAVVALWSLGPLLVVGTAATALVAAVVAVGVARGRAERAVDEALPVVVDRVAVALRAGSSVGDGLRDGRDVVVGPVRADLDRIVAAVDAGVPLADALAGWPRWRARRSVRMVVGALTLGIEVGARSRPLDGVAATLRADVAAQDEIRAAAAQARAQAAVMIGAPLLFVAANAVRDPAGFGATLHHPVGLACLAAAVGLDGAGAWWMGRLMRGAR